MDSVLAVPYDAMTADLPGSHAAYGRVVREARAADDYLSLGRAYERLSQITQLEGQADSSTFYILAAVDVYRAAGLRLQLGIALCDLGFNGWRRDLPLAFRHYREGLALLKAEGATEQLSRAFDNYGVLYEANNDLDSAWHFYTKALANKELFHDSIGMPYSLNKMATVLIQRDRFVEAERLFQRADTIRRAIDDRLGLADQPVYFGDLYQAWGRYPEAIAQFTIGLEAAAQVDFPYLQQYCYEHLAECHEALGDHRAALQATRAAAAIKDSIAGETSMRTILELKERYNAAEKDREITALGERAARKQLYVWLSLVALGLVVVVGLLFHQTRQRKERAKRDAAIIREREAGLKAVFAATETERGRLARELHDGVGQQLGGLKHRLEALKDKAPLTEVIGILDDTSREVRDMAHQMMPKALVRLGLAPALEELVHRTFTGTSVNATVEHFGMNDPLRPELSTGLYRIAQELIGNILKHAQATRVDVQLLRNKGHVVLLVQDDGRGFDPTANGHGIGLQNITDRSRALGGSFDVETTTTTGTLSTVRIPIDPISA